MIKKVVKKGLEEVISTEDVIKGLKCCTSESLENHEDCPFSEVEPRCYEALMKAALKRLEIQSAVIAKLEDILNGRGKKNV